MMLIILEYPPCAKQCTKGVTSRSSNLFHAASSGGSHNCLHLQKKQLKPERLNNVITLALNQKASEREARNGSRQSGPES